MLHAIRRVAREIHRRSVWQVLAAYLGGSWAALRGIQVLTVQIGLPAWTPSFAALLLALGLPVVVATAVVQGGLPFLRIEDVVDPNELVGLTPEQVHVVPEAHPLHGLAVFTWRNAMLAGVMGLAVLVTSVVAWLTMWSLGIGPVGSLLAQGAISDGEPVLIAEFENRTDAADLGRSVTAAFGTDIAESGLVTVVDGTRVSRALARMQRPATAPLTPALARDLAVVEEIRLLVEGEVRRESDGYRVSVRIVMPPFTSPVSQFHESAADDAHLVPAIDLLAERVRARFGESLRVIRAGSPLVETYGAILGPVEGS